MRVLLSSKPGAIQFVFAIDLKIGAMYVLSITIILVERCMFAECRLLKRGSFCAILLLSVIMYFKALIHDFEVITVIGGAALISVSHWSSI